MEISDLLLSKASDCPPLSERIATLARALKWYTRNVVRTNSLLALEPYAADTETIAVLVEALQAQPEPPTLEYPDYKTVVMLLALCREDAAIYYLYDLISFHIKRAQIEELVYFSDVFALLDDCKHLNGLYNRVAGFFYNARRQSFHSDYPGITEMQFQRVEKNFRFGKRTFKENVYIKYKKCRSDKELAERCGMEYTSFCRKFRKEFGQTLASWMRERRCDMIIYLLVYTDHPLIEISRMMNFPAQHNFNDFCTKHLGDSPGNLRTRMREHPNGIFRRKKEVKGKNEE
ncbi:helix-turn-helix transcriptional regulator [Parabacteroides sp.]